MSFVRPWLLLLIPLFALAQLYLYYRIRSTSLNLPTVWLLQERQTWRTKLVQIARFIPAAAAVLLLIALAGPQRVEFHRQVLPSGIDIVVALDISGSMAGEDFLPLNRLAVAKDVLRDFMRGRPSDRIGLVLFSGVSISRSPLTLQHEPLIKSMETVQLGMLPEGTAIGSAILSGINRLSVEQTQSKGDRILLLITDGRNNAGEVHPVDTLTIVKRKKIKIYTIGVGSFGTVPFPVISADGKKTYRYEKADVDESLLADIAERSGGRYFRASDPKSLQLLFAQINNLEKSTPKIIESRVLQQISKWFTVPALCLFITYVLLTSLIVRIP